MKSRITLLYFLCISLCAASPVIPSPQESVFLETKNVVLPEFPDAFNPSILAVPEGFLVSFRYPPDPEYPYQSCIGLVLLNEDLESTSPPYLLKIREQNAQIPPQAEDARLFHYRDAIWIMYNDNPDEEVRHYSDRRDMFLAELIFEEGKYVMQQPLRLIAEDYYERQICQKNWAPFVWEDVLFISYTLDPHEVLYVAKNGVCRRYVESHREIPWEFGHIRGSSSPKLIDGEYVGLFHAGQFCQNPPLEAEERLHYVFGIYTTDPSPPFAITTLSEEPLVSSNFYTKSDYYKRVIFPGGFVLKNGILYVAYGKNDAEIWIGKLDWEKVRSSLIPTQ